MIFIVGISFIFLLTAYGYFLKRYFDFQNGKREELTNRLNDLKRQEQVVLKHFHAVTEKKAEEFLFYNLARKLAPCLNREGLFSIFSEEIRHLGPMEKISFSLLEDKECLTFPLEDKLSNGAVLCVKTDSELVKEYLPHFARLLELCLERITLYNSVQQMSIHDFLTGLYNRRYFMYRFEEEFNRAREFNLNLSFLMIDIDDFKKINDTYGHLTGDALLKEITAIINNSIREIDFASRFGGEEFSLILPDTDKAGAIMVAERICLRVNGQRRRVFDHFLEMSVSIGVSSFPQDALFSNMILDSADKALYQAKVAGKNRVSWL